MSARVIYLVPLNNAKHFTIELIKRQKRITCTALVLSAVAGRYNIILDYTIAIKLREWFRPAAVDRRYRSIPLSLKRVVFDRIFWFRVEENRKPTIWRREWNTFRHIRYIHTQGLYLQRSRYSCFHYFIYNVDEDTKISVHGPIETGRIRSIIVWKVE